MGSIRDICRGVSPQAADLYTQLPLLKPIPKGLRPSAQGCEERATLGWRKGMIATPKGLWPRENVIRWQPIGFGTPRPRFLSSNLSRRCLLLIRIRGRWFVGKIAPSPSHQIVQAESHAVAMRHGEDQTGQQCAHQKIEPDRVRVVEAKINQHDDRKNVQG